MPVGIELKRDNGHLLLTNNLRNPLQVAKGTLTTDTLVQSAGAGFTDVSSKGVSYTELDADAYPIIFVSGARHFIRSGIKTGSTWTWSVGVFGPVGTSFTYHIFAKADFIPVTGVGLEIYPDAVGAIPMFSMSANAKPLRVVDVRRNLTSVSYPNTRDYALAYGKYAGYRIFEDGAINTGSGLPDPSYYALIDYARAAGIPGGNLGFQDARLTQATSSLIGTASPNYADERDWTTPEILVADVTGY